MKKAAGTFDCSCGFLFHQQRLGLMLASAVAATSTTASSVSATTTAAAAATTTALFARLGFVNGQRATAVILLVQATDRFVGGIVIPHLDETETLAAAGITVLDDLSTPHLSERAEQLLQV